MNDRIKELQEICDLEPIGNNVIIKAHKIEKTKSGIILEQNDSSGLSEGYVIFIGPACKRVKVGDCVMYGKNVAPILNRNGEKFRICYESYINCTIDTSKRQLSNFEITEE